MNSSPSPAGSADPPEIPGQQPTAADLHAHIAHLEGLLRTLRAENTALRAWVGGDPVALAFLQLHRAPTTTCGSTE